MRILTTQQNTEIIPCKTQVYWYEWPDRGSVMIVRTGFVYGLHSENTLKLVDMQSNAYNVSEELVFTDPIAMCAGIASSLKAVRKSY